jgi:hypothetical protein
MAVRVLVTGDVITDHYLFEGRQNVRGSTVPHGARFVSEPGGAGLLGRLLSATANATVRGPGENPPFDVECGFQNAVPGQGMRAGVCVLGPRERWRKDPKHVYRIVQSLGYTSDGSGLTAPSAALAQPADIVVLDDAGLEFRRWPSRDSWPPFLHDPAEKAAPWIVLKSSGPVGAGDLFHTIRSGKTQSDKPADLGPLADRTILVCAIDDLRRESVRVDSRLSWEQTATDLVQEFGNNRCLESLTKLRAVVVRIGLDGAFIIEHGQGGALTRTLVFDPSGVEGSFHAGIPSGTAVGYQTCLAAAVVVKLAGWLSSTPRTAEPGCLADAAKAGLGVARSLLLDGFAHGSHGGFPVERIATEINSARSTSTFSVVSVPGSLTRASGWTIVAGGEGQTPGPLWGLAHRVALQGVSQLTDVPYLQFAKLFSVDRSEIESLRTLERLLTAYRDDRHATKPLSIAAFGRPGAGKSFGVKQLAAEIFKDTNPLEFNLAQFSRPEELYGLYHQIRDRVLQGQTPLVFWDEFDSRNLFWLQYLLGPMQDGTFQEGQVTHPIGRCVFVFAGGTRYSFDDFGAPPASVDTKTQRDAWEDGFRASKGPDFKSRLAGFINVLGPDPRDDQDVTFPVRRALLLRVHLGIRPDAGADIDLGLLKGFLRVKEYRHGSRSLEKLAEQVRRSARAGLFNRSDLPPRPLIDLHVDADEFLKHVESV